MLLLRKLVVFERLLARLHHVAEDRWILKGAVALHFRSGANYRTTKDVDLGRWDDERSATEDFARAVQLNLDDHFRFVILRTNKLEKLIDGASVRYHVSVSLAGRRFEEFVVDVGFGDPLPIKPDRVTGPNLLRFAGIEPVPVPVIPLSIHVAEKVHAYTRIYSAGRVSSRVKDLVDLVLISYRFVLDAGQLRGALNATFEARRSQSLPQSLAPPPAEWNAGFRPMASAIGLEPDLVAGYARAQAFLNPILCGIVTDEARWNPAGGAWY